MTERPPNTDIGPTQDIDTESVGLLTIDTGSQAIISCNGAFAEVLGRRAADVRGRRITDFVDVEVQSVATAVIEGIRAGYISSVDGNVDLVRPAGSVGVDCWILATGSDRPHTVAMAGVVPANGSAPSPSGPDELGLRPLNFDPNRIVLATLDDDWRIIELAPGTASQLGLPEPSATMVMPQLRELAHPADAPTLDALFGRRASMETPDTVTLRLRGADEQWLSARVTVSPLHGPVPPRFGLVVWLMQPDEAADAESTRVALLEDQLARIRRVVQSTEEDAAADPVVLTDLTIRQRQIVDRLLDGHRVDAIARDLYVSPSTVRNHLSAIFEKVGVASQSELIELLRGHASGDPDAV